MEFSSVLVANRGEIALRVMRSIRQQGMACVAVYSDTDSGAPHVQFADQAVHIGPSPAAESYLLGDKIIEAALSCGAGAIHPGYGFLSENAEFARAVVAAGLVFIGPPPEAVEIMGDKAVSKRAMMAAGVPCVPGYQGEDQSDECLVEQATAVGYPLMVKAAAGGGGRGMRLVHESAEIGNAIKLARSEAENAFGSGDLILERAIMRPRHVEFQVFADQHGNIIHLGERDCSVQRRHQKVVEESPCPVMTPELRERMGQAAVEAARAVNYVGAGTVEFLLEESGEFYFLEMNTRLQVEHPVTELVTGLDLVQMQLEVALGLPLRVAQSNVTMQGSAIEVRLYAEDPGMDFLPSTGAIDLWSPPGGEGIRVDAGIATGYEVSPYYDSMVAKIIAWGETRAQARQRLMKALDETVLAGPTTNRDFLLASLGNSIFAAGEATTAFIEEVFPGGFSPALPRDRDIAGAAVIQYMLAAREAQGAAIAVPNELKNWSSTGDLLSVTKYEIDGGTRQVSVAPVGASSYHVTNEDSEHAVQMQDLSETRCRLSIDGGSWSAFYHADTAGGIYLCVSGGGQFSMSDASRQASGEGDGHSGPAILAPMHGLVLEVEVEPGQTVLRGQPLITLEAMKMQHVIKAPFTGTVLNVGAVEGSQVNEGAQLLEIEAVEQ